MLNLYIKNIHKFKQDPVKCYNCGHYFKNNETLKKHQVGQYRVKGCLSSGCLQWKKSDASDQNKKACEKCERLISKSNYMKHLK